MALSLSESLIKYCTYERWQDPLRVAGVSYTVSATDEGLEGDVGDKFAKGSLK